MPLAIEDAKTLVVILMLTLIFWLLLMLTRLGKSLEYQVRCAFSNAFHKISLSRLRCEGPAFGFKTITAKKQRRQLHCFFPGIVQNNLWSRRKCRPI